MAHSIKNALLIAAKDKVETKLPDELKEPVNRTVLAGLKFLYSPTTHAKIVQPIYEAAKANGFNPGQIANGMVNLLVTLGKASGGKMAIEAAFPAGVILLCYVLDDLEQTKGLRVTPELLKATGSAMVKQFAKAFGVRQGAPGGAPATEPPGLAETVPPPPGGGM